MIKTIACFFMCVLGFLQSEGQTHLVDSLRSLVQKINQITPDNTCAKYKDKINEKIAEYKSNISKIRFNNFTNVLAQVRSADSVFFKADYNYYASKGCLVATTIMRIIKNLDSLIRVSESSDADTTNILKAVFYVRNEFSGFISVRLSALTDSNAIVENPQFSLNSTEPFIISPAIINDRTPVEIFIRPGINYLLAVTAAGYNTGSVPLKALKDTALSVNLKKLKEEIVGKEESKPARVKEPGYMWIPATLLVIMLFVLGWKFLSRKKFQNFPEPVESINAGVHESHSPDLEQSIKQINEQIEQKDTIKSYTMQTPAMPPGLNSNGKNKHFLCEIMMTAGPRKPMKNNVMTDKDLGEDVCGFIMDGDQALVWILDGASDYSCLRNPESKREYFSSRLLAQSIARDLKSHFSERRMGTFDKTMLTILGNVKSTWLEAINSQPDPEKDLLKNDIKSGFLPECATTAVIARLSLSGDLNVYRIGDSKILAYSTSGDQKVLVNSPLLTKNTKSFDWIFFRLVLTEKNEFDIQHNQPLFEIVTLENIQTIVGISDGVGQVTLETLKKEYPGNSEAMRNEIIYQLQGTGDDKALYIVEIKD